MDSQLYRINLCLAANVECADEVWPQSIYSKNSINNYFSITPAIFCSASRFFRIE